MTSIVYDFKEIGKAARGISRSFDWYPDNSKEREKVLRDEVWLQTKVGQAIAKPFSKTALKDSKDEPLFYADLMGDGSYQGKPLACEDVSNAFPRD